MRLMNVAGSDWRAKMYTVYNPARRKDTFFGRKNGGESDEKWCPAFYALTVAVPARIITVRRLGRGR